MRKANRWMALVGILLIGVGLAFSIKATQPADWAIAALGAVWGGAATLTAMRIHDQNHARD